MGVGHILGEVRSKYFIKIVYTLINKCLKCHKTLQDRRVKYTKVLINLGPTRAEGVCVCILCLKSSDTVAYTGLKVNTKF